MTAIHTFTTAPALFGLAAMLATGCVPKGHTDDTGSDEDPVICDDSYTIGSNEDVLPLEGCEIITGSLTIASAGSAVTDLSALYSLREVQGDLTMHTNWELTTLVGLNSLQTIGGDLTLDENPVLAALDALTHLETIGDDLYVLLMDGLTNLDGLSGLTEIGCDLEIESNELLVDISGLSGAVMSRYTAEDGCNDPDVQVTYNASLRNLDGLQGARDLHELIVENNEALENLHGLENVTDVSVFRINWNTGLENLDGLDNLTSVGSLDVSYNDSLSTIDALNSLRTANDGLNFKDNPVLESLDGLNYLTAAYSLTIHGNAALSDLDALVTLDLDLYIRDNDLLTDVSGLSSLDSVGSDISIYQNDGLCDDHVDEVLALTYYGGSYSVDNDGDCD